VGLSLGITRQYLSCLSKTISATATALQVTAGKAHHTGGGLQQKQMQQQQQQR